MSKRQIKLVVDFGANSVQVATASSAMVQTAAYLGFKRHDIPILVARGLLKPLGRPPQNCEKYFARTKLVEAENNED